MVPNNYLKDFRENYFSFQGAGKLKCLIYRKIKLRKLAISLISKHVLLFKIAF